MDSVPLRLGLLQRNGPVLFWGELEQWGWKSWQQAGITPQHGTWCLSWDNNTTVGKRVSEPK